MTRKKIMIIDYGMGNLASVANALEFLSYVPIVSSKKEDILNADAFILPGVGGFPEAIKRFNEIGIKEELNIQVLNKGKPFLGICLGMQLIALDSIEYGLHNGLGWINGHVVRLEGNGSLKIPHVGWNNIQIRNKHPLFANIDQGGTYYFDHSYHLKCDSACVIATCSYGEDIVVAIQKGNIFAAQFHPEKSQVNGLKFLRNFLNFVEAQG